MAGNTLSDLDGDATKLVAPLDPRDESISFQQVQRRSVGLQQICRGVDNELKKDADIVPFPHRHADPAHGLTDATSTPQRCL